MRWFRVGLFALSAGIAGWPGRCFAGLRQTVGAGDFIYFNSLLLLLFAAVFGVTSITGAVLGGVALMALPGAAERATPRSAGCSSSCSRSGAILLARDPNGLANQLFKLGRWLERRIAPRIRANLPSLPGSGGGRLRGRRPTRRTRSESEGVPAHAH